jgi:hypothetical protein
MFLSMILFLLLVLFVLLLLLEFDVLNVLWFRSEWFQNFDKFMFCFV